MEIRFFIDAAPVGMPRLTQTTARGGKRVALPLKRKDAFGRFNEHPVVAFKQLAQVRARQAYQGEPLTGPIRLHLLFLLPRPKRLKAGPRVWAPVKPDFDNLDKAVCDALNDIIWRDDAQVVDPHTPKMYAASDETPGVQVVVEELS